MTVGDGSKNPIIGQEGLATSIAQLAGQVSSLEKAMLDGFASIRELMNERWDHHEIVHELEQKALAESKKVEEGWRSSQNEWRAESQDRQRTYLTTAQADADFQRVEAIARRNDERLVVIERFVTTAQAQLGTLRALMAVIILAIAVAGFILQQTAH